jgi:FAD binding domain
MKSCTGPQPHLRDLAQRIGAHRGSFICSPPKASNAIVPGTQKVYCLDYSHCTQAKRRDNSNNKFLPTIIMASNQATKVGANSIDAQLFRNALVEGQGLPSEIVQLVGDDGYEQNRNNHFNLDMICHPLLFMMPSTTQQVSKCIRGYAQALKQWKAAHPELDDTRTPKLSVCGGRHSSRTFVDNAVVLDLSRMKQVQVDVENQTVSVQGGVKIQQLMDTLAPYHLSPVTGTHSDTGVIGLTLGGGQGFLSKQFGPAIDQIVSAEVVLADGAILPFTPT